MGIIRNIFSIIKLKYLGKNQESLIFKPKQKDIPSISDPDSYGLKNIQESFLNTAHNERIQIWLYDANAGNDCTDSGDTSGNQAPFVIAFHGNTGHWGNVGYPEDGEVFDHEYRINLLKSLQEKNISFCAVSLRGYGKSEGNPSENSFIEDIESVTQYLIEDRNIDNKEITVFGESLGACSAFICAEHLSDIGKPAKLLATVAAFTTMKEKVLDLHPDLKGLGLENVIRHPFDSLQRTAKISTDTNICIMHPENDETTDIDHAYRINDTALKSGKDSEIIILKDSGHITWDTNEVANNIVKYYK